MKLRRPHTHEIVLVIAVLIALGAVILVITAQ